MDMLCTNSYVGHAPLTSQEKQWLKKNWNGEWHFLVQHGLKIYNEEDREEGRAIVRAFMKNDGL
jgi:hypothetical protein